MSLVQQDKICFRVKCCLQLPEVRTVLGGWVLEICLLFIKKYELDIKSVIHKKPNRLKIHLH